MKTKRLIPLYVFFDIVFTSALFTVVAMVFSVAIFLAIMIDPSQEPKRVSES